MIYPDDYINKIICGDCLELMKDIPDKSIDLILIDPPYGINKKKIVGDDDLQTWKNSLLDSQRILKDDSFYMTFCSIEKIDLVMEEAKKYFIYRWQVIFYTNNGMARGNMGFSVYYPCLIFMKGKAKIKQQIKDVYETSTSTKLMKERFHPYQKDNGFISKLILSGSKLDGIVFDPFLGSGTTALVSKQLNRRFIGIDISSEYCEIARQRIEALT